MLNQAIKTKWITAIVGTLFFILPGRWPFKHRLGPSKHAGGQRPKNVIVLMTDGTGAAHTTITRWYKSGAPGPGPNVLFPGCGPTAPNP